MCSRFVSGVPKPFSDNFLFLHLSQARLDTCFSVYTSISYVTEFFTSGVEVGGGIGGGWDFERGGLHIGKFWRGEGCIAPFFL